MPCRRNKPPKLALYYTLSGQEGPANSVPLSRDARGFHSLELRPSVGSGIYRVSVAYDVTVCRRTEATVVLHSGIQVTHHTLCVRENAQVLVHVQLHVCVRMLLCGGLPLPACILSAWPR